MTTQIAITAGVPARGRPRFYIPVKVKFAIAIAAALTWVMVSIMLSRPWMESLSEVTHPLFALFAITFIAYVPGFMNTFLVASLLLDRRPARRVPAAYPGITILIAAYQEEAAIADTISSVANAGYGGPLEVLVLNDGSTDRTGEFAARAIEELPFAPTSPAIAREWAVSGNLLYTSTPVASGTTYGYFQFNMGLTKAF